MPATLRVLIVDDEPAVALALRLAAEELPWQVEYVDTAEAALTYLDQKVPDVMLVDKNLPGMSGIELLRVVHRRALDVTFVMITGYGSIDTALETLRLGIDGYLTKPFTDVYAAVNMIADLAKRHASRRERRENTAPSLRQAVSHFQKASAALRAANAGHFGLVVATSPFDRQRLSATLSGLVPETKAVCSVAEAKALLVSSPPIVIVVHSGIGWDEIKRLVCEVDEAKQFTRIVVAADGQPNLSIVSDLIAHGVGDIVQTQDGEVVLQAAVKAALQRELVDKSHGLGHATKPTRGGA